MKPKVVAYAMAAGTVVYAAFATWRGWLLITSGELVPMAMGIAVVVIPVIGMLLLIREMMFGFAMQAMGRTLEAEGGLPEDDLPRRPSGRVEREAADRVFERRRREAQATPDDWRGWYRLGIAYDDAGDRTRAREAMRHAHALYTAAS